MTAIKRGDVKIYLADAGTANATLATTTHLIAGEIISYEQSGGAREVETQHAFGGDIDKEKPIEQFEVSFEFVPAVDTAAVASRWDSIMYAKDVAAGALNVYTSAGATSTQPNDKVIGIQVTSVTSVGTVLTTTYKTHLFNNCNVTALDMSHSADDNRTGNITFKFSPTTKKGVANYASAATTIAGMPAFSALDNN